MTTPGIKSNGFELSFFSTIAAAWGLVRTRKCSGESGGSSVCLSSTGQAGACSVGRVAWAMWPECVGDTSEGVYKSGHKSLGW